MDMRNFEFSKTFGRAKSTNLQLMDALTMDYKQLKSESKS
jgi:hypothetical protein